IAVDADLHSYSCLLTEKTLRSKAVFSIPRGNQKQISRLQAHFILENTLSIQKYQYMVKLKFVNLMRR
ncbi:MAG: hypothetical protein OXI88_08645, partial [Gammaproteobacteria bacterium]|nr:hypothetical protein [Gammaproteobacteria bacterium]